MFNQLYCSIPAGLAENQLWLGGSDLLNEEKHRWLDGTSCMPGGGRYTKWRWAAGNPHNGDEDYVAIRANDGKWLDRKNKKLKYICEAGLI